MISPRCLFMSKELIKRPHVLVNPVRGSLRKNASPEDDLKDSRMSYVESIDNALYKMKELGMEENLNSYKELLREFSPDGHQPRSSIDLGSFHGSQQLAAIRILNQMESNGVHPDKEVEKLVELAFSRHSEVWLKITRMKDDPRLFQLKPTRLPPLARSRDLLHVYGLRAKKNLSQNFLLRTRILRSLVREAGISPGHRVIEVGPGPGNLTREILSQSPFELLTIEKDRRFLPLLEQLADSVLPGQMKIMLGDALDHDFQDAFGPSDIVEKNYRLPEKLPKRVIDFSRDWHKDKYPGIRIIGNLPFSVSTALLIKWLHHISLHNSFWQYGRVPMLLTFQDEVAKRICANPATPERSRLSLMAQNYCHVEYKFKISGKAFVPPAMVDTGVVRFQPRIEPFCRVPFKVYEKFVRNLCHHRNHNIEYNYMTLFPRDLADVARESFSKARVNPRIYPFMISNREAARLCDTYWDWCQRWPSLYAFDYRASRKLLPLQSLAVLEDAGIKLLE